MWKIGGLFFLTLLFATTMANDNAKTITRGNNDLTNKLYTELSKKGGENVFFSPISLHTVLSLLHQGAEGETENVLRTSLGLPDKVKSADGFENVMTSVNNAENVTLDMANRVYVMNGYEMKPAFKAVAVKSFSAGAENVDFSASVEAARKINGWVEEKTKNKIKDLISPDSLDSLTRMVLVNAIYFKGDWADKFNKDATKVEKFYTSETDSVDCDMMHATRKYNYKDIEELDAQVLQLPYKNKDISLVIVLPKERTGIRKLEEKLKTFDLTQLTYQMRWVEVIASIPKFKIETTMELNEPLKNLGLSNIFSDEANLSGLIETKEGLKVSKVVQKAFIEVNEEGAEAAAATGRLIGGGPPVDIISVEFTADKPFTFFLVAEPHLLFVGKISKTFSDPKPYPNIGVTPAPSKPSLIRKRRLCVLEDSYGRTVSAAAEDEYSINVNPRKSPRMSSGVEDVSVINVNLGKPVRRPSVAEDERVIKVDLKNPARKSSVNEDERDSNVDTGKIDYLLSDIEMNDESVSSNAESSDGGEPIEPSPKPEVAGKRKLKKEDERGLNVDLGKFDPLLSDIDMSDQCSSSDPETIYEHKLNEPSLTTEVVGGSTSLDKKGVGKKPTSGKKIVTKSILGKKIAEKKSVFSKAEATGEIETNESSSRTKIVSRRMPLNKKVVDKKKTLGNKIVAKKTSLGRKIVDKKPTSKKPSENDKTSEETTVGDNQGSIKPSSSREAVGKRPATTRSSKRVIDQKSSNKRLSSGKVIVGKKSSVNQPSASKNRQSTTKRLSLGKKVVTEEPSIGKMVTKKRDLKELASAVKTSKDKKLSSNKEATVTSKFVIKEASSGKKVAKNPILKKITMPDIKKPIGNTETTDQTPYSKKPSSGAKPIGKKTASKKPAGVQKAPSTMKTTDNSSDSKKSSSTVTKVIKKGGNVKRKP